MLSKSMVRFAEDVEDHLVKIFQPMSAHEVGSYCDDTNVIDIYVNMQDHENHPCKEIAAFVRRHNEINAFYAAVETFRVLPEPDTAYELKKVFDERNVNTAMLYARKAVEKLNGKDFELFKEILTEREKNNSPDLVISVLATQNPNGSLSLAIVSRMTSDYDSMPEVYFPPTMDGDLEDIEALLERVCDHVALYDPRYGQLERENFLVQNDQSPAPGA